MGQQVTLRAKGLYTHPNPLDVPEGGQTQADNVVIRREGVIEPRRGVAAYGDAYAANRLAAYADGLLMHVSTGTLRHYSGGTWTALSGSYPPPDSSAAKTRFAQAAQNLYLTSSTGIYRMDSLTATPALAGVPPPQGFNRDEPPAVAAIGAMSLTSNVVSVTTSNAHGFYVGQVITQTSATEAPYAAGNYTVVTVGSTTTFTYALTAANDAANANQHTFAPAEVVTSGGFLADGYQAAYRVTFNAPDANNAEKESAPSPRTVVANATGSRGWVTGQAKDVVLRVFVPSGVAVTHSVRLYRSAQQPTAIEPSEEMGLVYESFLKAAELTQGWLDITDIVPDARIGATLYTAPSQEGIEKASERPPLARHVTWFRDRMLYGRTSGLARLELSILAVGDTNGIQNGDNFMLDDESLATATTGTPAYGTDQFTIETAGSDGQDIRNTALNFCAVVNRVGMSNYRARYVSGAADAPGHILLEATSPGTATKTLTTNGKRAAWAPKITSHATGSVQSIAFNLSRTSSTVTATIASSTSNLEVGESVTLSGGNSDFPNGVKTILTVTSTTFTYSEAGAATTLNGVFFASPNETVTAVDTAPHRVYESKPSEPEAVPLLNYADLGSKDAELLALVALRDAVFAFKEDGLYRGVERGEGMEWQLFDPTIILLAPDSAVALGNMVYGLTSQGVIAVSDTGAELVSRPIEKTLLALQGVNLTKLKQLTFAVARESDREYELRVITATGDTAPTQAFIFNTLTRAWTRDTLTAACGVQNPADDKRYLGGATSVLQERKDFAYSDYSDVDVAVTVSSSDSTAGTVTLSSASGVAAGDVLTQSTYELRITAVASNTLTIAAEDVATIASLTAAAGTVKKAISTVVKWAPVTGGSPATTKLFQESALLFSNAWLPAATLAYTTELVSTEQTATIGGVATIGQWTTAGTQWDGTERPFNLRVPVPQETRRATQLVVKWSCATAWAVYGISGLSVSMAGGSDRVAR